MSLKRTSYLQGCRSDRSTRWLVEGLVPAGVPGMIVAPPAWGKTSFAIQLGLSLVLGHPFLGVPPTQTGDVLFLELEASALSVCDRIQSWVSVNLPKGCQSLQDEIDRHFHIITPDHSTPGLCEGGLAEDLLDQVDHHGLGEGNLRLIVVDSLAAASTGDENAVEPARHLWSDVSRMVGVTGATVLLLHHPGKGMVLPGGGRASRLDPNAIRGSSAHFAFARFVLQGEAHAPVRTDQIGECRATLRMTKPNNGLPVGDVALYRNSASEGFWARSEAPVPMGQPKRSVTKLQMLLGEAQRLHREDGRVCRAKLNQAAEAIGMDFRNALRSLKMQGLLNEDGQLAERGIGARAGTD